jgi:DNA mismatch repair ATPase MutS
MESGKFDEELVRMSAIADRLRPDGMMLFNESFAATHELEGSEIARQIVSALRERGVTVFFVTHMYEFARSFLQDPAVRFLRADRAEDGSRSFRLHEAEPLSKSFGIDLYRRIFEDGAQQEPVAGAAASSAVLD